MPTNGMALPWPLVIGPSPDPTVSCVSRSDLDPLKLEKYLGNLWKISIQLREAARVALAGLHSTPIICRCNN